MKLNQLPKIFFAIICSLFISKLQAQIILLGENDPYQNVRDGNFSTVWDYWRNASQSPDWTTKIVKGSEPMGLHYGTIFSSNEEGLAESKILNGNPYYQHPKVGDEIEWSFGADMEYRCNGSLSLSLVFGSSEKTLAENVKLIGADNVVEHFSGTYTITKEDSIHGLPYVRARFFSEKDVKVYLHYVNIKVYNNKEDKLILQTKSKDYKAYLTWQDSGLHKNTIYKVHRKSSNEKNYEKIKETSNTELLDQDIVAGVRYQYIVTRSSTLGEIKSEAISFIYTDKKAPSPPSELQAEVFDTEVKISWAKNKENDIAYYSILRGDENGKYLKQIATNVKQNWFEDIHSPKGKESTYVLYAHDFSQNKSVASSQIKAKVNAVFGASFGDLIKPIPITSELSSKVWGGTNVLPRDPFNGIENPEWSYWGGRPVQGKDKQFHMLVTRWSEGALKGHWDWPNSTVTHVVAVKPTGPYKVKEPKAYSFKDGFGHNPDIILLNDGSFALYSLIEWEPTIFTSSSMNGPWKREGIMEIDMSTTDPDDTRTYQYTRNLSGVQLEDGRFLIVSKFGCMMVSDNGLLGPYKIVSGTINHNKTIPERYRKSNYEDPVMWKDEVQFHLIINAFLDYRAIYLRSSDGIHWKYDPGLAYTPNSTIYSDGTKVKWDKLERPHILQDKYGRATHLSVAVIDVPKKLDYGNDNHNSKNIIIPLTVPKRIEMINREKVNISSKKITIKIISEIDFNAQVEVDRESLRFGASEEVNFGRGSKALSFKNRGKDLIVEFSGTNSGLTANNFVCKLHGKTKNGELIIGYSKLSSRD